MKRYIALVAALLTLGGAPAIADTVRQEAVRFARGTSGATLTGQVRGYDSVQYSMGVSAGQQLDLQLDSSNSSLYFNVTAPGPVRRCITARSTGTAPRSPSRPAAPI